MHCTLTAVLVQCHPIALVMRERRFRLGLTARLRHVYYKGKRQAFFGGRSCAPCGRFRQLPGKQDMHALYAGGRTSDLSSVVAWNVFSCIQDMYERRYCRPHYSLMLHEFGSSCVQFPLFTHCSARHDHSPSNKVA
jgi:hypothetical protein